MNRTPLSARSLPDYTQSVEIFNFVSHTVGCGFGVIALVLTVLKSAFSSDPWGVVGSAIYGASLIALYTMSSIYHALKCSTAKKVFQVLDHCTIYFLIAGTYTPILFSAIRTVSPLWCWLIFGIEWGLTALAVTLTAVDLKKYSVLSMICYIGMGWCIIIAAPIALKAVSLRGFLWLLWGGISYTVGAVFYGFGKKRRYIHSVFHLFVVIGSILQFISIFFYII